MFWGKKLFLIGIGAVLVCGFVDVAFAKKVRVEIIRDAEGVPVKCADDPVVCHNRWVPGDGDDPIPPVAFADPGDTVIFETRDAFDNQFNRDSEPADVGTANLNLVHPLTGPVFINGAEPGDVLAVTIVSVVPGPDRFGYTVAVPGFGFLRDLFIDPFIVRWEFQKKGKRGQFFATSADLPGVRIPGNGFPGTIGVALSREKTMEILAREDQLAASGGFVLPPTPADAAPDVLCGPGGPLEADRLCLRTIPPRENGGNMDVKQMIAGTTLLFPCFVDGCLLSTGDVHFAQGDGEVAGTAIEMNAIVTVKVDVRKGIGALVRRPEIEGKDRPNLLKKLAPKRFLATTGIPIKGAGEFNPQLDYLNSPLVTSLSNLSEDVTLAARDALINMIDLLTGPRSPAPVPLTDVQAYILCSAAVDLRISQLVDVPNFVVTAILPLDVFRPAKGKKH
ncbi:MAG: acetamidase/formamidase family protein [Candidatus Methylomirabilales bacterium]